jgi:hypothetical protein
MVGDGCPMTELRTAKPKPPRMKFNAKNPHAIAAAKKHAATLIKDITKVSKKRIHDAVVAHFESGLARKTFIAMKAIILKAVGDDDRARLIARTEIMRVANMGQREAWDQAVKAGMLDSTARRVWIATPIGPCDACRDLDGETADLDGQYPDPGGDGPILHPACRCTEGIV